MHPSFGRRIFQPRFEKDGLAELAYILADVNPRIVCHHKGCFLDIAGTQNVERRGSASAYVRDLETWLR